METLPLTGSLKLLDLRRPVHGHDRGESSGRDFGHRIEVTCPEKRWWRVVSKPFPESRSAGCQRGISSDRDRLARHYSCWWQPANGKGEVPHLAVALFEKR